MNRPKQKGTAYETELVQFLRQRGWVHAERRTLSGSNDRGDISGIVGVVIEAKNCKTISLAAWVDELETEMTNADCDIGFVAIRRRGTSDRSCDYAVMSLDVATRMLARLEGWDVPPWWDGP